MSICPTCRQETSFWIRLIILTVDQLLVWGTLFALGVVKFT